MLQPAPIQTNYQRYQGIAYPGMLADSINYSADTRIVETAAGIGFGLAVSQGAGDDGCVLGGNAFVGITRADVTLPVVAGLTVDQYSQYDNAGVLIHGDIWVLVGGAVTKDTAVHYDSTTGVLSGAGGVTVAGAKWMTTSASGTLAVCRIGNISGHL